MPKIFISYRRADSGIITGRIYDKLISAFGSSSIFRDIDSIAAGVNFKHVLEKAANQCDVFLIVLGPQWASITDDSGQKRLHNPDDFVRLEVEIGLSRKDIPVIPVLVMNATMPKAEELPASLADLLFQNAVMVRNDPDFHHDMERLIRSIKDATQSYQKGLSASGFSVYKGTDPDSLIVTRAQKGTQVTILGENSNGTWLEVELSDGKRGWAMREDVVLKSAPAVKEIPVGFGFGVKSNTWRLFFTSPMENPNPEAQHGIDGRLADEIGHAKQSLDIAAFEFNNKILTQAVLDAHESNVAVRVVTHAETGFKVPDNSFQKFKDAGIPVIASQRAALMHNKFMILDRKTVWTGSWNYSENSTYRNNENSIVFDSTDVAGVYLDKFEDMWSGHFGPKSAKSSRPHIDVSGIPVEIYFTPADDVEAHILNLVACAAKSVHFMAFSFTNRKLADAMIQAHARGALIKGLFENQIVDTEISKYKELAQAGIDLRLDKNPYFLHHSVIVVDEQLVLTGSLNFSNSSLERNDENVVIVHDPMLAKVYLQEFSRLWPRE